jgi:hypothetical protein
MIYMPRFLCIIVNVCFLCGLSFAHEGSTYLSRICEFDVENVIGLEGTGNFIITFEHISYSLDHDLGLDVLYKYKIKKMTQIESAIFGLSLRYRGQVYGGLVEDVEVDTLNILVNGARKNVGYKQTPYDIIDDESFRPIKINRNNEEEYRGAWMFNGYKGWYYFSVDFQNSNEAEIEINYKTVFGEGIFDDAGIEYNSRPFWTPVSGDAEIKIIVENRRNEAFLSNITGCKPLDTLVAENWEFEKLRENTIAVTYAPAWYSENKRLFIGFSDLYESGGTPNNHFFEIIRSEHFIGSAPIDGVYLGSIYSFRVDNISNRELKKYELIFLTKWQLRIMRNSFYALHKYRFSDNTLNQIFYAGYDESWFNTNSLTATLSPIEIKNIEIIQNLENFIN